MTDEARIEVTSPEALRDWLELHHEQPESIWLVRYKKHCGDRYLAVGDMVRELLCFGWIDSQVKRIDDDRVMQRISPRKPGSHWSRVNKDHIAELVASGRMHPAGLAAVERARADGSWDFLDDIEAGVVPLDLAAALDAHPGAREGFDGLSDSARKQVLYWVKAAKRDATRKGRIDKVVAAAAEGRIPMG